MKGFVNLRLLVIFYLLCTSFSDALEDIEGNDGNGCTFKLVGSKASYTDALARCQSYGGTLAIPDTQPKMTYLLQLFMTKYTKQGANYYIGGNKSGDGNYYWEGGSPVNTTSYNGFTSTSNTGAAYMRVRVEGSGSIYWLTRNQDSAFICQIIDTSICTKSCSGRGTCKRTNIYDCHESWCQCNSKYYGNDCQYEIPTIQSCSFPSTSSVPNFPLNISCDVTGTFPLNIQWTVNGAYATNNSADTIFYNTIKTTRSLTAKLTLKRAVCLGVTKIKFTAWNSYTVTQYQEKVVNINYNTVNNITTYSPECDGLSTTLRWSSSVPDHLQQKLQYEISTIPATKTIITSNTSHKFTNLTPERKFEAKINTISNSAACTGGFVQQSTVSFTTGLGRPQAVYTNATNENEYECQITWSLNTNITSIKIFITGTTNMIGLTGSYPTYKENVTIDSVERIDAWRRSMPPNKNYTFQIQASNCAGYSETEKTDGNCLTHTSYPFVIPKIDLTTSQLKNGEINVTIPIISEENGPINCVLVCVTNQTQLNTNTSLTHAHVMELTSERGYVAYCVKDVSKPTIITLGNGEVTHCEVEGLTSMKRSAKIRTRINGTNKALENNIWNSIFLITITKFKDDILYHGNEVVFIRPDDEDDNATHKPVSGTPTNAAIGAVAIVPLVSLIILGVFFWKRSKRSKPDFKVAFNHSETTLDDIDAQHEHAYANFANSDPDVVVSANLETIFKEKLKNNFQRAKEEFVAITKACSVNLPHNAADANKSKNRYKNIYSYDHSRVVLSGEEGDDYINACYIDGYQSKNKFIATQGPLESTVFDFWRMICEQNVSVVVMLARCVEGTKNKCFCYWTTEEISGRNDQITVSTKSEQKCGGYVKRVLEVKFANANAIARMVTQFQMTTWPDHGTPNTTSTVLNLYRAVCEVADKNPVVVHCSAGAGRTGTFIGLDIAHNQLMTESQVNYAEIMLNMRKTRLQMIQTWGQFLFLQKLVLELHILPRSTFTQNDFIVNCETDYFQNQLQRCVKAMQKLNPIHFSNTKAREMFPFNSSIPYDNNIVYVTQDGRNDPYNASYILNYYGEKTFIAAEHPNPNNAQIFSTLITQECVKFIICLEDGDLSFVWKLNGHNQQQNILNENYRRNEQCHVTLLENTTDQSFKYIITKNEGCSFEEAVIGILEMIKDLKAEMQSEHLIVCVLFRDDSEEAGIFIAATNLIKQLNVEGKVDVIQALKDINDMRPKFVHSFNSIRICTKVVKRYLSAFNIYANIT